MFAPISIISLVFLTQVLGYILTLRYRVNQNMLKNSDGLILNTIPNELVMYLDTTHVIEHNVSSEEKHHLPWRKLLFCVERK